MPLAASGSSGTKKLPIGGMASITWPGDSCSFAQFENAPPAIFLMPTRSVPSVGAAQIE